MLIEHLAACVKMTGGNVSEAEMPIKRLRRVSHDHPCAHVCKAALSQPSRASQ
jgi:hypothetical protein